MEKKLPKEVKLIREYKLPSASKTVSYSQLSVYLNCPHQWYLTYVEKQAPYAPSIHTVFGTSMHETIQYWLNIVYKETAKIGNELDLESYLQGRMAENYSAERKRLGTNFSTNEELSSFLEDGKAILIHLKKKRNYYFPSRQVNLVGTEVPLLFPVENNVHLKGFIDLVLYYPLTGMYKIIDFKTSTTGWKEYDKKNDAKIAQLIIYREFFAKQFNVSPDKIDIEYIILKRKVPTDPEFPAMGRRIQDFIPVSGKVKTKKAMTALKEFVEKAFTPEGTHIKQDYERRISSDTCRFCLFKENPLCGQKQF